MNNQLQIFKNEKLNLKAEAIQNKDGSISISAEDTAIGFGWTTVATSGNTVVRWKLQFLYLQPYHFHHFLQV